jgi:hypothetical protein
VPPFAVCSYKRCPNSLAFGPTWTSTALPSQVPAESARASKLLSVPYLLPCNPEEIDPLCLYQACRGVLTDFYCNIKAYAEQSWVPEDALIAMVTDQLVSKRMGAEPSPATFFIPEKGNAGDSGDDQTK